MKSRVVLYASKGSRLVKPYSFRPFHMEDTLMTAWMLKFAWCYGLLFVIGMAVFFAGCASDSASRRSDSSAGSCPSCGK